MENKNPNTPTVQHVAKSSSDELLRKFAEVSKDKSSSSLGGRDELRLAKRVKRSQASWKESGGRHGNHSNLADQRKSLLPAAAANYSHNKNKPMATLVRRMGMGSKPKIKLGRQRSIITAIEKTWRRTVEGASRVLMEKHYNSHKRLISDYT